jgi:hypothetical protein
MSVGRVLLAGAVAGAVGVFTSGMLVGWLFHPYQRLTPNTWRTGEGATHYALSSVLTIISATLIAVLYSLADPLALPWGSWLESGLAFGALCWAALAAPILLSNALFVNLHRGFVAGLLLSWLIVALLGASAAAWVLRGQ